MTTIIKRRLALYFLPLMLQVILQCLGYHSNITGNLRAQNLGVNATGATPHNSSIIDLNTGNTFTSPNGKGILPPSVALTGVTDAVTVTSPAISLLVYNTAAVGSGTAAVVPGYYYWDGAKWVRLQTTSGAAQDWNLLGNAGTTPGTNFIGTSDAVDLVIKTNNTENMRVLSNGNVGVGTSLPSAKFHLFGGDGIIADNTQANFSVNRTAQTLYLDNFKSWSDNGLRFYDGNSNGHLHIGNAGFSYLQSYAPASIAPGTLGTSTLDFDDNTNFSDILLNPLGGNVGIGTTTIPYKFTVDVGSNHQTALGASGSNAWGLGFFDAGSLRSSIFYTQASSPAALALKTYFAEPIIFITNGTFERMRIDAAGNIAIGSATPNARLDVMSSGNTSATFGFGVRNSSSTYALAVRDDGNVGIGTTAPTEKLQVQGSVKIVDGTEGAGKVLTSDAAGKASWKNVGLGAPGITSSWTANALTPPEIYPNGSIQTYGPFTIPTTGWYILSSSRWFYEQNTLASADLGAASFWMQINTSATNLMDQPGQVYEYRGVTNTGSSCPPSGSFVYMLSGTSYYVHQQTGFCQSASTGERGFVWSFVQ